MDDKDLIKLKESSWYKSIPDIIKKAIEIMPPTKLYKFKDTNKECFILAYTEPAEGNDVNNVTLIIQKTGKGGLLSDIGLSQLDTNKVFNVKLTDLIPNES